MVRKRSLLHTCEVDIPQYVTTQHAQTYIAMYTYDMKANHVKTKAQYILTHVFVSVVTCSGFAIEDEVSD